jgi:hypothetical protein
MRATAPTELATRAPRPDNTGYVQSAVAAEMIRHYFGEGSVSEVHASRLEQLLDRDGHVTPIVSRRPSALRTPAISESRLEITPAQLEQQCAECETVDALLLALQKRRTQSNAGLDAIQVSR